MKIEDRREEKKKRGGEKNKPYEESIRRGD